MQKMNTNSPWYAPAGVTVAKSFTVKDIAIIDEGTTDEGVWYTIHTRDQSIWKWLLTQNSINYYNHPSAMMFDIHEELYLILCLKFG